MKMKMVEAKVFAALCSLLIIHFGSADHAGEGSHVNASTSTESEGTHVESPTASAVGVVSHVVSHHLSYLDTRSGLNDTKSLSNDTTMEAEKNSSVTATPEIDSGSNIVAPSVTAPLESKATQPLPLSPSAMSNSSTTLAPLISTSTAGLTQRDHHDQPNIITVTTGPSNASADFGNHTKANSSTEMTSSAPPKMATPTASTTVSSTSLSTTTAAATTAAATTSSSTTTTQVSAMKSTAAPPSHSTLQTEGPHQGETSTRPSSSTTQGKGHVASPSQLNVNGEDTKMVPNSPTLDPLLASLVSAFIITAVIIILLLFLKLRKRGNQPEFRRLQDLPMDDMMEDTPLSMYSY